MTADIEQSEDQTQAAFWGSTPGWHGLGTSTGSAATGEEALAKAHMDWEITQHPVTASVMTPDGFEIVTSKDSVVNVRRNPFTGKLEALSTTSDTYEVLQNSELAAWGEALVAQSDEVAGGKGVYHSAVSMDGGRHVALSLKLPTDVRIFGEDKIDIYLTVSNGHDSRRSAEVILAPVRVVCANTYRMAIGSNTGHFKIRHTSGMRERMEQAKAALGLSVAWLDDFKVIAEGLAEQAMTDDQFLAIADATFGKDPGTAGSKRAKGMYDRRTATLMELWSTADTQAFGRGSKYGAFGALTEYVDHLSPVQAGKDATDEDKAIARAERVLSGDTDAIKTKIWGLLTV